MLDIFGTKHWLLHPLSNIVHLSAVQVKLRKLEYHAKVFYFTNAT